RADLRAAEDVVPVRVGVDDGEGRPAKPVEEPAHVRRGRARVEQERPPSADDGAERRPVRRGRGQPVDVLGDLREGGRPPSIAKTPAWTPTRPPRAFSTRRRSRTEPAARTGTTSTSSATGSDARGRRSTTSTCARSSRTRRISALPAVA